MLLQKRIPIKYILQKIKYEIVYVLSIGFIVHLITDHYKNQLPEMPISIPAFIGTAISVILSFKLNQSYDRWWEARKIWGSIVNDSRSFVLQLQSFIADEHAIKTMAYRQIAWCYSLGQNLRGLNASQNLDEYLSEQDLKALENHNNKPLAILQQNTLQIAELKKTGQLDIFSQVQINNTFVQFSNAMGMAERIKSTVFPTTYRLFLHFFIYIFVVTLSISLKNIEIPFEIPLLLMLSSAFFLLEKSATHLQDPFMNRPTDTAMTAISKIIEINIKQLLGEKNVPATLQSNDFYIL